MSDEARGRQIASMFVEDGDCDPFFVVDLGQVVRQMDKWKRELPMVRPFYAVKCNNDLKLLQTLVSLGTGFDCASKQEFDTMLQMGVHPEDIVFANPCKQVSHIKAASDAGIKMVTFDNSFELPKIKENWPDAEVLLRITTDDSKSLCEFSSKFGASLDMCPTLIKQAKELGINIVGVSFHVGSGCGDAAAFTKAAYDAKKVFDMARDEGFEMKVLDIGGGFPGDDDQEVSFEAIARLLRPALTEDFSDVRIIAEPGRFFACASHTLVCNVFSKRILDKKDPATEEVSEETWLYINDGAYNSFNNILYDHAVIKPYVLNEKALLRDHQVTTIFGPTCDALDCLNKQIRFPETHLGEWLYFTNFGAYTCSAGSAFNGFSTDRRVYIVSVDVPPSPPESP
jgi:ornithine decarboxylase